MKKEKWLLKEIDKWERQTLISPEAASSIKELYSPKKNINLLVAVFSIVGSLLIGAGIILILAKNWNALPFFLRVILAFLPLVASQSLCVFVLLRKYESFAWRESASILITASLFAAIAMVGQIFHTANDYGTYILTCGLLSLPIIYILDAAAPLAVYYWTILNWAALEHSTVNSAILLALFAAGAAFVFIKRKQENARFKYMLWITLIGGSIAALVLGSMLNSSLLLNALCYFTLLLSATDIPDSLKTPFNVIGLSGSLVTAAILTYENMWAYADEFASVEGALLPGALLLTALSFACRSFKRDKLNSLFILSLVFICVMRYAWSAAGLDMEPYAFIFMILSNLTLLAIGVGFMIYGVRHTGLITTNMGLAVVCGLIVMRFFDSDMDFLWRGIVFLSLGTAFLLVNLRILRRRKISKTEAER